MAHGVPRSSSRARARAPLVALRRLPPAPPDTADPGGRDGAGAPMLASRPTALRRLCDSDEPLLAGDRQRASPATSGSTERDLDARCRRPGGCSTCSPTGAAPWLRRSGPLPGRRAVPADGRAARPRAAPARGAAGARAARRPGRTRRRAAAGLVLANLQLGDADEAERWLRRRDGAGQPGGERGADRRRSTSPCGPRSLLARGDVDAGLRLWRRRRSTGWPRPARRRRRRPAWTRGPLEVQAAAVVAHARTAGSTSSPEPLDALPDRDAVRRSLVKPSPSLIELPVCGTLLLALGLADLDRGRDRPGCRMIALAERFRFLRNFQPTMSGGGRARRGRRARRRAGVRRRGVVVRRPRPGRAARRGAARVLALSAAGSRLNSAFDHR